MTSPVAQPVATASLVPAVGAAGPAGTLGLLGGGQLGRMFVHAAQAQGWRVLVLEPDAHSPAAAAADAHLAQAYDDAPALDALQARCAGVTTEFENVPAGALARLARAGVRVAPPADAVAICQHRAHEKRCFERAGVPCAPYAVIDDAQSLASAASQGLLPGILKTARLGYDGKGQARVADARALAEAWQALGAVPCVLESLLPLQAEISVIVARAFDGSVVHLPVQQNLHRAGILAVTQVPAPDVSPALAQQAVDGARQLAATLAYVGVLCVEFFVLTDGRLVANEMAPRPHNSGHYSIDACDVSQFDLQLRTLVGWPLPQPRLHSAAVMLNLLGDLWFGDTRAVAGVQAGVPASQPSPAGDAAVAREPDWTSVLGLPGVHLHLYGKVLPRRGRKMGHLTVTAATASQARETALEVAARLGLPAF